MGHPIAIHDLPLELLFSIFRLSFAVTTLQRDRCRLSLVCRLWRDIVQESPYLWTEISGHDTVPYIRRSFAKSEDLPIDVYYLGSPIDWAKTPLSNYIEEVLPHLSRCRSIVFPRSSGSMEVMLEPMFVGLHSTSVPHLEALILRGSASQRAGSSTESELLQLPGMTAFPRLRPLEIDGVPCELSPPGLLLNNVLSLNLVDVLNITTEELLGVLHNSPFLERLELGRSPTACPSETIVAPIHLPRLMALHLIFMPIPVSNFFLKTVHAPKCSELVIVSQFPESPDDVVKGCLFTSDTQHFNPVLQTLLTRGRHKDIEVTNFFPKMQFLLNFHDRDGDYNGLLDHGVVRLDFKFHSVQQIEQTVHWLAHCLGLDTPKISIRLFVGGFDEARWMDILDSRTTITHFAFYTLPHLYAIRPSPILTHMAQPTLSRWPLHEMEEFIFGVADDDELQDEAVLKMLRERYGPRDVNPGDSSGGPSNGTSYPNPLRRIRLAVDGRTSSYMLNEVRKILPEATASLFLESSLW